MEGISLDRRSVILLILAAVQLVMLSSVWPRFLSPNEASRVFAAHAFVTRGTFQIDPELAEWGMIDDVSVFEGRHYSNKAPGLIWAAVPVLAVVHLLNPLAPIGLMQYILRFVLVSSVSLVAALLLVSWRRPGEDRLAGGDLVFVLLFASVFGVYAGTFFSHAWAGCLLLIAAWLLLRPGRPSSPRGEVVAGFLIAMAAVSEYPSAVVGGVLALAAGWGSWRRMIRLAAGSLLPLGVLAVYNHACFGSVFTLSTRFEALPRYHRLATQALLGFSLPRPVGLVGLLISPLMGLFFLFPVMVPIVAGPAAAWRQGDRRLAVTLASAAWLLPVVMAGYHEWAGGSSYGPRYLALGIPLAVVGMAYLRGRLLHWWIAGALLPSALAALSGRLVPPFPIDDVWTASTLRGWVIPALEHGLWNGPPWAHGRVESVVVMTVVVVVWLVAAAIVMASLRRQVSPRTWLAAGLLTVALLATQFGAGVVTRRQGAWFRHVAPAFAITEPPLAEEFFCPQGQAELATPSAGPRSTQWRSGTREPSVRSEADRHSSR